MKTYDENGFFVALQAYGNIPVDGEIRHFKTSENAVNFLASLQAGNREHGVVLISRDLADEPAQIALEVLAADGWPTEIYSSTEKRIF